jgi:hypothetical protein
MAVALVLFERETNSVIDQFLGRRISFSDCISQLADALAKAKLKLKAIELSCLADAVLANNARVMLEMHKLAKARHASIKSHANATAPAKDATIMIWAWAPLRHRFWRAVRLARIGWVAAPLT